MVKYMGVGDKINSSHGNQLPNSSDAVSDTTAVSPTLIAQASWLDQVSDFAGKKVQEELQFVKDRTAPEIRQLIKHGIQAGSGAIHQVQHFIDQHTHPVSTHIVTLDEELDRAATVILQHLQPGEIFPLPSEKQLVAQLKQWLAAENPKDLTLERKKADLEKLIKLKNNGTALQEVAKRVALEAAKPSPPSLSASALFAATTQLNPLKPKPISVEPSSVLFPEPGNGLYPHSPLEPKTSDFAYSSQPVNLVEEIKQIPSTIEKVIDNSTALANQGYNTVEKKGAIFLAQL